MSADLSDEFVDITPFLIPEEGIRRIDAFHLALGKFVSQFAGAENGLRSVLRHYSKTTVAISKAVFPGVRVEAACSYLNRLAEIGAVPPREWSELKPVLDQLRVILRVRNDILHYGASNVDKETGAVTNKAVALTEERVGTIPISAKILDDLSADLMKVRWHFMLRHVGHVPPRGKHASLEAVLMREWCYAPPPQSQRTLHKGKDKPARGGPSTAPLE